MPHFTDGNAIAIDLLVAAAGIADEGFS
ncbi:hypothetical protein BOS5A_210237 [Bosea sp. EC-HK365B]|nr:hypothetical protein BOSE7B_120101 [Bosea sp. 7B]VVT59446.1 hypothetical protein BOS5A_210237 [Bosea sp. EC-HK365B]VXB91670.1 hypothetical protein BOSE127_160130 [Bosea sp. 127]VXC37007.1 hypothetical protein BOSE29B_30779 [Bosea sp. 29B]